MDISSSKIKRILCVICMVDYFLNVLWLAISRQCLPPKLNLTFFFTEGVVVPNDVNKTVSGLCQWIFSLCGRFYLEQKLSIRRAIDYLFNTPVITSRTSRMCVTPTPNSTYSPKTKRILKASHTHHRPIQ